MKKLELKTIRIKGSEKDTTYKQILTTALDAVPVSGIKISEMRARLKILDKLELSETWLEIDDSELPLLKTLVLNFDWAIVDAGILQFNDDVEAIK